MLTTVIMIAAELYARSRPTGTAAPATPGELEGAEEELPAARAGTRVQRHHGRATGTVTDAEDAQRELDRLPVVKAAGIGLGQALALIPGTSRSGSSWMSSPRPPRPRPSWSPAPSPPPCPASWPCRS